MRSITFIILPTFVAHGHAKELAANRSTSTQDSLVEFVDELVDRAFKASPLRRNELDRSTLGKPGQLQLRQVPHVRPQFGSAFIPHTHSSTNAFHSATRWKTNQVEALPSWSHNPSHLGNSLIPYNPSARTPSRTIAKATAAQKKLTATTWKYDPKFVRNFCIVAHIDHGKSTLADRLLEYTKTVAQRDMQAQLLDSMDIERERGITIKLQAARMLYPAKDGNTYLLNLIDTPGHVDFGYEVSRSLAACEGALLVVDASQGVEAQTIANVYLALDQDLEIVPVLNKIDLPAADPEKIAEEVEATIGLDCTEAIHASAKAGIGIEDILEAVVKKIPPPEDPECSGELARIEQPLRALIFDSYYDNYRGVIVFFRVVEGSVKKGDKVRFMMSKYESEVLEVGVMTPAQTEVPVLRAGEVGYLTAALKEIDQAKVGDTIALANSYIGLENLPGYAEAQPMVYCGLYPSEGDDYNKLRDAIEKLKLNDAALTFSPETSAAMGFGFRCGFLGLLHMEVVSERLEREFDVDLIVTAPSVVYKVREGKPGKEVETIIDTPSKMPDPTRNFEVLEPYVRLEMMSPTEYTGPLMELGISRRGIFVDQKYLSADRVTMNFDMPLAEVITDFFDELKSRSKGYASMSFDQTGYRADNLQKMGIKIAGEDAPALAVIVHRDKAYDIGKAMTAKLKEFIPRQQFKVQIQAYIGVKIIASATISPITKDVLAKCYGGDITRKKKLLEKQKKGKKRMKALGKVNVPQEAFMAVIKINN